MFKRAIALDPAFAQPRTGLADADMTLIQWLLVPAEEQRALRAEALSASEEALRLNPDLAEAHVSRANVLSLPAQRRSGPELSPGDRARAGPRDAWYYYGRFLFSVQRYADAARAYEDPRSATPTTTTR